MSAPYYKRTINSLCQRKLDSISISVLFLSPQLDSVMLVEDDDEDELDDEEDLDIGTEHDDPDSPPWDEIYGEPDLDDNDDSNEDTALLRVKAARTEIIVTPISPVSRTQFPE